jgi:parvulin-like peptidyl-prolyl isomerase
MQVRDDGYQNKNRAQASCDSGRQVFSVPSPLAATAMNHRTLFLLSALCLSLSSTALAQQEEAEPPLANGIVARVGEVEIGLQEYKDFLWTRYGKRPLNQLIDHVLVKQAATDYGLTLDESALEATYNERLEPSMQGRSPEEFEVLLREAGQTMEMFTSNLRIDLVQEQLLDQLVLATRVPTDDRIQSAFVAKYGDDGVKVRVRHVLVMPHFLRAERIRNGEKAADIKPEEMKAAARKLAESCLLELQQGAAFEDMVAKYSQDQVSSTRQGELPVFRPGLYGADFTAAVASLPVGQNSAIIESGAGFHILQVMERTVTELADVRAALVTEVMQAAPNWQDREQVLAFLREAGKIKLW